jgi:serine/threonine-protein kinase RsbW
MSNQVFRLSLRSTYKESEKVPDFVSDIQKQVDLDEKTTANLMLALSEAATNAIVHGNKLDKTKKVEIKLHFEPDRVIATVTDQGEGFDPDDSQDPLAEENLLKASGRGVFLIKELADEVEYSDGGTKVRFTINLDN